MMYHSHPTLQDCPKKTTSGPCGGLAKSWDQLYTFAADCCREKLNFLPLATCEAKSSQETIVGSQLWYVDFTKENCVKDCEDSDPDCGGFANSWDDLYPRVSDCCDKLWWKERSECTE